MHIRVTDRPSGSEHACTAETAAWLVMEGLAVAYLVDVGDGRQYLHLTAPTRPHLLAAAA